MTMTSATTVDEAVDAYLESMRRRDKSPRSIRTYGYVLGAYVAAFSGRDVSSLTFEEIEAWVMRPRRRAVSNTTLRKDAVVVRCLHEWLAERGVHTQPLRTLQFGKLQKATPRPVDDDVWMRVWGSDLDDVDRVWLGLGYYAGLRRLEIITLTPSDVDITTGEMLFKRKGGFHANVEYEAAFDCMRMNLPHLVGDVSWVETFNRHVWRRIELGANYVWPDTESGSEADCNRLNKRCDALSKRLALPAGALTPHRLRHSCATNLLRCGVPIGIIQRQLAHSSIDITQRYLQMSGELARSLQGVSRRGLSDVARTTQ